VTKVLSLQVLYLLLHCPYKLQFLDSLLLLHSYRICINLFGSRPFILKSLIESIDIIGYYITFVVSLVKGRYHSPYFPLTP
jgi:hypothetical protein